MRPVRWAGACTLTLLAALLPAPAGAAPAEATSSPAVYTGSLDTAQLERLRAAGVDGDELLRVADAGRTRVETVLAPATAAKLIAAGLPLRAKPVLARTAAAPTVFRPYDAPGGIRDELAATVARFPEIAELETIGHSVRGVPIQAVKVTAGARTRPDGSRPAVLYLGGQHAREWITPEMARRLLHHVLDGYGTDRRLTRLVNTTELWFVPVVNPDGYDYTFTPGNRLWRKNLRDNDGDGKVTATDGVDLNRNFAEKWGYDDEGSSGDPAAETYRGTAAGSEPETRALDALLHRIRFRFLVNYHSAAQLLLYGVAWQVSTPSPDDQIAIALAGDDAHPAVPGYDPDISAELYTTNGDTDFHAQARTGAISFTPEMSTCETASAVDPDDRWQPGDCPSVFNFPDDEKLIQAEFAENIPFALSLAESAHDPANPVSSLGRHAPDLMNDPFPVSYGTSQQIAVTAKRALSDVRLHFKINGGRERTAETAQWQGGRRYGAGVNRYFAERRGTVPEQKPGDHVTAWFTAAGGVKTEPFSYTVAAHVGGDVLVLAAEDVTGIAPATTDGATSARYAQQYVDALQAAGHRADVYDLDAHGRMAPHPLGVLSHYRAVVWETGDDEIPRATGQPAGTTTRAALETDLAVRDYLNEGGRLLYAGQHAGQAESTGPYVYQPDGPGECASATDDTCLPLSNDFEQYWLGVDKYLDNGGTSALAGTTKAFRGFTAEAGDQQHTASFLAGAGATVALKWQRTGHPAYEPYSGSYYLWSGQADRSYKRLTRTVDLTAAKSGHLKFRTSFDIEEGWDFLLVEAHEAGTDTWTTLPDAGGLTTIATGDSCPDGIAGLHPFLAHYQGPGCVSDGTTGSWNAATGTSGGWKSFDADLSAYAGRKVEISISYVSDWGTQGLGVFVDDVQVEADGVTVAQTSFEDGLGGWTVPGPPPGSGPNTTDFGRSTEAFDFGAGVATAATVYLGFGPERMTAAARADLVARVLRHLGV